MSYSITYQIRPDYLHAIATGECTKENLAGYVIEIISKCSENKTKRLFIEQRLKGPRLGTEDVYQVMTKLCTYADGLFEAVAYVDVYAEDIINTRYGESIASSRNIPFKVFFDIKAAEDWLKDNINRPV